jgi:hypothetical protein
LILGSLKPLWQQTEMKGVWIFYFDTDADLSGEDDNPILAGKIIQTDPQSS